MGAHRKPRDPVRTARTVGVWALVTFEVVVLSLVLGALGWLAIQFWLK